jgi:hypothetical protein
MQRVPLSGDFQVVSNPDDLNERGRQGLIGDPEDLEHLVSELKRLVAHPLAPRHVRSFDVIPNLPVVKAVLPEGCGPTRIVRAIVEIIAEAIGSLEGQTIRLPRLSPLQVDRSSLQAALSGLLGITELGQTDSSSAPVRRSLAAKALGLDLATLGGDKGFRTGCEPSLLRVLADQLVSEESMPSWLVEEVTYHYRHNADRLLTSTEYHYTVISQKEGRDFFINHESTSSSGTFELLNWSNCDLVKLKPLSNRTIELHFRLAEGTPGRTTHFAYQLKPTERHVDDSIPQLATIGQLVVTSVRYIVDFETPPQKLWSFAAVPPPLEGAAMVQEPTRDDDLRLRSVVEGRVSEPFRSLRIRHYYGIAWRW